MYKNAFTWAFLGVAVFVIHIGHAQTSSGSAAAQMAVEEEVPDEELAPAAIQLDTRQLTSLLRALYQATRETKEPGILQRLTEAKNLLQSGADLKATDPQGRTALHWAVFGSSYSTRPKVVVLYEEIAHELLEKGVDINRQDVFHNTALDYLLYSPNFEMQTLLLENSATSGFLAGSSSSIQQIETRKESPSVNALTPSPMSNLLPGQTVDI